MLQVPENVCHWLQRMSVSKSLFTLIFELGKQLSQDVGLCKDMRFFLKSQEKKEGERKSHLDTISLSEGKHLRHSSRHTGLQRSKVIMTK